MFAKIRHVAAHTERYDSMAKFYQTIFGMKQITTGLVDETGQHNPNRGRISDGVIGFALLAKRPGSQQGLDHFGFECEDVKEVLDRITTGTRTFIFQGAQLRSLRRHQSPGSHRDSIRSFTERNVQCQRGISQGRVGTTAMAQSHRTPRPRAG